MRSKVTFVSCLVLTVFLFVGLSSYGFAEEMKHKKGGASMELHHIHAMMSHGLAMAAEGSTMVMLAGMNMAPSVDEATIKHGQHMIMEGKAVIERMLNGPEMKALHQRKYDEGLMKYTHDLGNSMLKVVAMLEKMKMEGNMSQDMMTMHHMHVLMNHGLVMAAEGANMVMLGQMGMAKGIDAYSIEHGKMMLSDARSVLKDSMEGKAMQELHGKGVKMDNAMMAEMHGIGDAALKVLDLLTKMPSPGAK